MAPTSLTLPNTLQLPDECLLGALPEGTYVAFAGVALRDADGLHYVMPRSAWEASPLARLVAAEAERAALVEAHMAELAERDAQIARLHALLAAAPMAAAPEPISALKEPCPWPGCGRPFAPGRALGKHFSQAHGMVLATWRRQQESAACAPAPASVPAATPTEPGEG